jgi:hypothetical protein
MPRSGQFSLWSHRELVTVKILLVYQDRVFFHLISGDWPFPGFTRKVEYDFLFLLNWPRNISMDGQFGSSAVAVLWSFPSKKMSFYCQLHADCFAGQNNVLYYSAVPEFHTTHFGCYEGILIYVHAPINRRHHTLEHSI